MRKPRSRYHHGALRDAALDAAEKELDAHGHVGFSLERVAKRLGVTPAALYRHYANRDALLREVVYRAFLRFVEALDAAALDPDDPITAIGRAYVRFSVENPGWFRAQFSRDGAKLSDRQEQANPKYAAVLLGEVQKLFGTDETIVQRWYLGLWGCAHGASSMAVEHTIPGLTDEIRLALAYDQLSTFGEGMRAAAASAKRRRQ